MLFPAMDNAALGRMIIQNLFAAQRAIEAAKANKDQSK